MAFLQICKLFYDISVQKVQIACAWSQISYHCSSCDNSTRSLNKCDLIYLACIVVVHQFTWLSYIHTPGLYPLWCVGGGLDKWPVCTNRKCLAINNDLHCGGEQIICLLIYNLTTLLVCKFCKHPLCSWFSARKHNKMEGCINLLLILPKLHLQGHSDFCIL